MNAELLDLGDLTEEEKQIILKVIKRDEDLRWEKTQQVNQMKNDIHNLRIQSVLRDGDDLNKMCARCHEQFGYIFNRGEICPQCKFRVCNACRELNLSGTWLCTLCFKQVQLKLLTGEWMKPEEDKKDKIKYVGDIVKASIRKSMTSEGQISHEDDTQQVTYGSTNQKGSLLGDSDGSPVSGRASGGRNDSDRAGYPKDSDNKKLDQLFESFRTNTADSDKNKSVTHVSCRRRHDSGSSSSSSEDVDGKKANLPKGRSVCDSITSSEPGLASSKPSSETESALNSPVLKSKDLKDTTVPKLSNGNLSKGKNKKQTGDTYSSSSEKDKFSSTESAQNSRQHNKQDNQTPISRPASASPRRNVGLSPEHMNIHSRKSSGQSDTSSVSSARTASPATKMRLLDLASSRALERDTSDIDDRNSRSGHEGSDTDEIHSGHYKKRRNKHPSSDDKSGRSEIDREIDVKGFGGDVQNYSHYFGQDDWECNSSDSSDSTISVSDLSVNINPLHDVSSRGLDSNAGTHQANEHNDDSSVFDSTSHEASANSDSFGSLHTLSSDNAHLTSSALQHLSNALAEYPDTDSVDDTFTNPSFANSPSSNTASFYTPESNLESYNRKSDSQMSEVTRQQLTNVCYHNLPDTTSKEHKNLDILSDDNGDDSEETSEISFSETNFQNQTANCTFVSDIQSRISALKLISEKQFQDEESDEYCVEHQIISEDIPDSMSIPEEEPNQKCSKYVLDMEEYIDLDDDDDSMYKDSENQPDSVDGGKTFIYEKADYILTEMNREQISQTFSQSNEMGGHKAENTVQSSQKAIRSQTVPSVKVIIDTSEIQPPPYTKQDQCNFFKSQFYRPDVDNTSDNLSVITETTEPTDDLTLNDLTTNVDLEENEDIDDLANTSLNVLSDNNFGSVMIKSPRLVKKAKLMRERGPQRKFRGEVSKDGTKKTSSKEKAVNSNVVSVVSPERSLVDRSREGDKNVTSDINLAAQKTFQSTSKENLNTDFETESKKIVNSEMTKTTVVNATPKTKHPQNITTSNVCLDNKKLNSILTVDADADFLKLEVPFPKARKLVAVNKREIESDSEAGKQIKSSVCQEDLTAGSTLQYVSDKQTISTPDIGLVPITHDYHFHTVSEVKNGNSCSRLLSENSNAIYAEGKPSNPEDKFVISNIPDNEGNSQRIIAIKDDDDIEAPIKPPRSFIDTVKVDGYLDTHHLLMTSYSDHKNTQANSNTVKPGKFMNKSTGINSNLPASKNSNIEELSDSHGHIDITGRLNTRKRDSGCILDDDCDLFTQEDVVGQEGGMEVVTENIDIKLSEKTTSCESDRDEYNTGINQEQLKSLELNDKSTGCKNCQTVPSTRKVTTNEIATNTEPLEDKVMDATNLNIGNCYVDVHDKPTSDTPSSAAPSSATPTNNNYVNTCTNNGDGNKINKTVNSATNKQEEEGLSHDPKSSLVTPPSPNHNSEKDYSEKPESETTDNLQSVTHNQMTSTPSITVSTLPTVSVTTTSSVSDPPISHTADSGKLSVTTEGVSDEGTSSDNTPEHRASRQSRLSIPSLVLTSADDRADDDNDDNIDDLVASHRSGTSSARSSTRGPFSLFSDSRESILSIYSDAGEINYGKIPVSGEVLLGVDYNYKTGALEIYVKQCKDLAPVDTKKNKSDPYIKTYLLPDKTRSGKRKTKIKKHTLNPTFDEVLRYNVSKSEVENRILWVTVWNNDKFGRNDFLGEVMLSLDCYSFGDPTPKWYLLQERLEEPQVGSLMPYKGDLVLSIKYVTPDQLEKESSKKLKTKKTKHQKGALQVMVKEARNLTAIRSNGTSDPFCKGYLLPDKHKSGKQKTPVVKKNCSPVWNYLFVFDDVLLEDLPERSLELTIWDHDTLSSNDFLGGIRFNLGMGIHEGKPVEWMDGRGEEIAIWQCMLDRPNTWIDACVNLRASMGKSGVKK